MFVRGVNFMLFLDFRIMMESGLFDSYGVNFSGVLGDVIRSELRWIK